jgi:hypothetical protein
MKASFVAENRRFLKVCVGAARFYGLLFLFLAGIMVAMPAFLAFSGMEADKLRHWFDLQMLWHLLTLVLGGLLALALAEFIRYVMEGEGEPRWILRHADKILFVYAVFIVVASVWTAGRATPAGSGSGASNLISAVFTVAHIVGAPLILIGVGITLRKILPIIQESKTLV